LLGARFAGNNYTGTIPSSAAFRRCGDYARISHSAQSAATVALTMACCRTDSRKRGCWGCYSRVSAESISTEALRRAVGNLYRRRHDIHVAVEPLRAAALSPAVVHLNCGCRYIGAVIDCLWSTALLYRASGHLHRRRNHRVRIAVKYSTPRAGRRAGQLHCGWNDLLLQFARAETGTTCRKISRNLCRRRSNH
jgi:hypothetical protein